MTGQVMPSDVLRPAGTVQPRVRSSHPVVHMDRQTLRAARGAYNEALMAEWQTDLVFEVAEYAMRGAVRLDDARAFLSEGDPNLNALLAGFEATALCQARDIQRSLFTR